MREREKRREEREQAEVDAAAKNNGSESKTKNNSGGVYRPKPQKMMRRTKSILSATRAAGVDVKLRLDDFENIEAYRKASKLQRELIRDQSWIIRLRKRQHFFLLVAQVRSTTIVFVC